MNAWLRDLASLGDRMHPAVTGWLLPTLVLLPLVAAVALLAARRLPDRPATLAASAVAAVTLVLAMLAAVAGLRDAASPGLSVDVPWVPALGLRLHLGVDGVSGPLLVLTALLGLLVCAHAVRVRPVAGRARGLVACYLAVTGGALATFVALDLLLFFLAFEVVLVPMWFVIAFWGDDRQHAAPPAPSGEAARRDAANRFILYTALGSAVMLLGLLLIAFSAGTTDLVALARTHGAGVATSTQTVAAGLVVLGLAVKAPMFPLHTWLPPAHTTAPTGGSVLLAGVLLKMGTYGLVRVVVPAVPAGAARIAPVLGAFAVAGILWGALACLAERDLKRLVAFSSVSHMGFVLLGVASLTAIGIQGALFANVAHGLITGLLFLVAGALKDRRHSGDLADLGSGLRDRMPRLGWLLAFGAVAGLGLPGLAGFWGEILAIAGAWDSPALGASRRVLAVLAVVGTALAAAYLLRVLYLLWHGPRADRTVWAGRSGLTAERALTAARLPGVDVDTAGDVTGHELAVAGPLVALTAVLGLLPWLLLDVTGPAVRAVLASTGAGG